MRLSAPAKIDFVYPSDLSNPDETIRNQGEHIRLDKKLATSARYSPFNKASLFLYQQRQREALDLLACQGCHELSRLRILEVGCGTGGVLREFLGLGATLPIVYGCDLQVERLKIARQALPTLSLTCANSRFLPYPSGVFDLVLQYTMFSSILDETTRRHAAGQILRVLKPGGMLLWYDFWLNPTNPQTRGIRPKEIRRLFPGCQFSFRRITLAPPITQWLAPISWLLCSFLEKLRVFNTHYLVAIRK